MFISCYVTRFLNIIIILLDRDCDGFGVGLHTASFDLLQYQ
jgi:hypothetical protein